MYQEPIYDRSLFYDDIEGARAKFLHGKKNKQFPHREVYQENLRNSYQHRERYQNDLLQIPNRIVPQGVHYFSPSQKRHFEVQVGEIKEYDGLNNLYDPPEKINQEVDFSLWTKDIEGAVPGTLVSKVIKNKEKARQMKQLNEVQQSVPQFDKKMFKPLQYKINDDPEIGFQRVTQREQKPVQIYRAPESDPNVQRQEQFYNEQLLEKQIKTQKNQPSKLMNQVEPSFDQFQNDREQQYQLIKQQKLQEKSQPEQREDNGIDYQPKQQLREDQDRVFSNLQQQNRDQQSREFIYLRQLREKQLKEQQNEEQLRLQYIKEQQLRESQLREQQQKLQIEQQNEIKDLQQREYIAQQQQQIQLQQEQQKFQEQQLQREQQYLNQPINSWSDNGYHAYNNSSNPSYKYENIEKQFIRDHHYPFERQQYIYETQPQNNAAKKFRNNPSFMSYGSQIILS